MNIVWIGIRFLWREMDVCTENLQNYVMDLAELFLFLPYVWLNILYYIYNISLKINDNRKERCITEVQNSMSPLNDDTFLQLPIGSVGIVHQNLSIYLGRCNGTRPRS